MTQFQGHRNLPVINPFLFRISVYQQQIAMTEDQGRMFVLYIIVVMAHNYDIIITMINLQYRSDVTSHSLAILLLDSQNSSLFSRQLSVRVCRKSARYEPSVKLQITSHKHRFTRLVRGLDGVTGQFSLHSRSAE